MSCMTLPKTKVMTGLNGNEEIINRPAMKFSIRHNLVHHVMHDLTKDKSDEFLEWKQYKTKVTTGLKYEEKTVLQRSSA